MGEAVVSDNELDLGNKGQFEQKVGAVNRQLQVQPSTAVLDRAPPPPAAPPC